MRAGNIRFAAAGSPAASQLAEIHDSTNPEILGEHSISGEPVALNCPKHLPQQAGMENFEGVPVAVGKASLP